MLSSVVEVVLGSEVGEVDLPAAPSLRRFSCFSLCRGAFAVISASSEVFKGPDESARPQTEWATRDYSSRRLGWLSCASSAATRRRWTRWICGRVRCPSCLLCRRGASCVCRQDRSRGERLVLAVLHRSSFRICSISCTVSERSFASLRRPGVRRSDRLSVLVSVDYGCFRALLFHSSPLVVQRGRAYSIRVWRSDEARHHQT